MVADGLLHRAFECWVGGADRQEEVLGAGHPLGKDPLVFLLLSHGRGGHGVQEGDGGRREEAGCRGPLGTSGEAEQVLQRDGAPAH